MAVPTVSGVGTTAGSSSTANPVVNLPPTVNAGDIIIVFIRKDNEAVMTFPNGWTKIVGDASDAADDQTALAWKTADGTEGGTTITITTSVAGKFASLSYAISGANNIEVGSLGIGSSTSPDPPSLTPSGGAQDYLWLWFGGWEGEQTSPPASAPTGTIQPSNSAINFTNGIGASSGTAAGTSTNCRVASARYAPAGSSTGMNPGIWTISVSGAWTAFAIALWQFTLPSGPAHTSTRKRAAHRFMTTQ